MAIEAARKLLDLHPREVLKLAPDAHASLELDIMSETPGFIGAEVFAAVNPRNNQKLRKDCVKMANRSEVHRYVFFMSPLHPSTERLKLYERVPNVQVWSVDF